MDTSKLEARKPELLAQIKNWLETEGLLQPGHEVILSISVVPSTALRIEFDDDSEIDTLMAMPLKQFLQEHREQGDRNWAIVASLLERAPSLCFLGQFVRMSERDFIRHRNVGRKTMEAVKSSLLRLNPQLSFGQRHRKMGPLEKAALESIPVSCARVNLRSFAARSHLKLDTLGDICSVTQQDLQDAFTPVPFYEGSPDVTNFSGEVSILTSSLESFHLKLSF